MSLRRSVILISSGLRHIDYARTSYSRINGVILQQKLLKQCSVSSVQVRNIFKKANTDETNDGTIQVYNGMLTRQILSVKVFSLTTSMIGLAVQPIIYNQLMTLQNIPLVVAGCSFAGFFTFVTPFLLHYVTKKYVTELRYKPDSDTYVATTLNFFCRESKTEFKVDDVKVPEIPGMFTTFVAKDRAMFLDPKMFDDPSHYGKIMGYDKPIDFKMYETDDKDK